MAKSTTVQPLQGATDDGPVALLTAYVDLETDPTGDPQFKLVVPTGSAAYSLFALLGERADEYGVFRWQGLMFRQLMHRGIFRWMITTMRDDPNSIELFDQLVGEETAAIRLAVLQAAIENATSARRKSSDPSGDFTLQLRLPADYFPALLARLQEHIDRVSQPALTTATSGDEG